MQILRKKFVFFILICLSLVISACSTSQTSSADPTALPYTPQAQVEPAAKAQEVTDGNPEDGKGVFNQYCAGCHSVEQAVELSGPSLFQAGARLQIEFIKNSIRHPLDYINPAYQESGMPEYISEVLTEQEFNDLVSYVASLK